MRKRVLLALGYFSTELYHGITRFAHEAEWILDTTAVRYGRILSNWRGDGILTYLRQDRSDLIKLVRGFHGPVVDFCCDLPNIKAARVIPDNTAAARLAAEHLLERNYRDLAFLQMTDSYNVRTRESSFRNTCQQAGANYMHWNYSSVSAAKKGSWLKWLCKTLQRAPRPIGVLAQSDNRSLQVLSACDELGLGVPQDLALVGIDNDETACELASVPLTSVDLGWEEIGYRGAKLLSEIIDGTTEPPESPVLIEPKSVITRRSSDMCMVENPDVSAAMAYIWANFRGSIKFDNIVDQTSVSRCVLYRLFKTHLGRSLGEEVTRKRLESAEDLLRNTKEKIRVVAEQSGFSSTVHLIRAFDKAYHCTPTQYRQANGTFDVED